MKLNITPTLYLRPDKKGLCLIRIRTTIKRKVTFYATGIHILPEQWKDKEVIKHPNKNIFNSIIRDKIKEIENGIVEGKFVKQPDLYPYCEKKIEQQRLKDSHGTWKHKKSYLRKLQEFRPHLQFKDITPSFMLDFENHCRALGNKPTTVWSSVKFVKTMVNAAFNDGIIQGKSMRGYKAAPYVNPVREFLTESEIETLETFARENQNPTLKKVVDWFLFGCYSGLRYDDVRKFDKKNLVEDRIILRTGKSKTDVSIKLHPKLARVIDRMSYKVMTNQKINDYLKVVAAACGITKNLTFHCSRHTFAVYFLNKGGSMESLSKILGHNKLATTAIYGKITDIRIDSEIDKVWG